MGHSIRNQTGRKTLLFRTICRMQNVKNASDKISGKTTLYAYTKTSFESRLAAKVCELCGTTAAQSYEIHHVHKVKDLKGKELWEQVMIAKRRKTIVLCKKCHYAIHNRILQKLSCNGEPCTSRDVSTVLGGDCANLSPKGGKAVLSYSTSSAKL